MQEGRGEKRTGEQRLCEGSGERRWEETPHILMLLVQFLWTQRFSSFSMVALFEGCSYISTNCFLIYLLWTILLVSLSTALFPTLIRARDVLPRHTIGLSVYSVRSFHVFGSTGPIQFHKFISCHFTVFTLMWVPDDSSLSCWCDSWHDSVHNITSSPIKVSIPHASC